jgi:multidrug efflux pump subunit AcrA (membrane-fusion protein)
MHGGKSTGAPLGNQNARQHGIYSDALSADEVEIYEAITAGDLEEELKIARLQLRRAMLAQKASGGRPELDEFTKHRGKGSRGKPSEEKHRARNYTDVIQKLLGRIGDLEVKRAQLLEVGRGGSDDRPPPSAVSVRVEDASMTTEEIDLANATGAV